MKVTLKYFLLVSKKKYEWAKTHGKLCILFTGSSVQIRMEIQTHVNTTHEEF